MSRKDSDKMQADSTKPQPPKRQLWWKIAALALGVLMIAGGISYSLITRNINASSAPLDKSAIPQIGTDQYVPNIFGLGGIPQIGNGQYIPNIFEMGDLVWVQDLNTTFIEHDFIFVILPDKGTKSTKTLTKRISDAAAKIEAQGKRVGTITLSPDDPEFSITKERLAIGQVPAVLAISLGGNGAVITDDMTEEDILQTYLAILQAPLFPTGGSSGCGGGSSSGCCGK